MASWTNPVIHATGDDLAVSDYNSVANNTVFNYQRPYAAYYNSITTAISSGSATQITLGGTTASGYGFSVSANNIIVPLTGIYSVSAATTFSAEAGSGLDYAVVKIYHNGSEALSGAVVPSYTSFPASTTTGLISASASDTIALYGLQTSGSSLSTFVGANYTFLHVAFVGSQ